MIISKASWHYRFNYMIQDSNFRDRAEDRRFTTCTYIRTTVRSMFQSLFYAFVAVVLALILLFVVATMIYVPIAAVADLKLIDGVVAPCIIGWAWTLVFIVAKISYKYGHLWRDKMSKRQQAKLTLLEQRIKDGKEGICTIIEVV